MKRTSLGLAFLALMAPCTTAFAHHSFAEWTPAYASQTGTVTDYQWENPHVWIMVSVPQPGGGSQQWGFETAGPSGLLRRGWNHASVKVGDKVTITYHTNRHGGATGNIVKVVRPDQSVLTTEDIIANPPGGAK